VGAAGARGWLQDAQLSQACVELQGAGCTIGGQSAELHGLEMEPRWQWTQMAAWQVW
jgi:hypothetical protein